jgi:hypothetical protein
MRTFAFLLIALILFGSNLEPARAAAAPNGSPAQIDFPKPLEDYHDDQTSALFRKLVDRVRLEPFNLIGTIFFRLRHYPHVSNRKIHAHRSRL